MSPHVPTATLTVEVSQEQSREGILVEVIALSAQEDAMPTAVNYAKLQDFMALRPDAREVRKALAVKLVYQGYLYDEIQTILDVSRGSITAWILPMKKMELTDYGFPIREEKATF